MASSRSVGEDKRPEGHGLVISNNKGFAANAFFKRWRRVPDRGAVQSFGGEDVAVGGITKIGEVPRVQAGAHLSEVSV